MRTVAGGILAIGGGALIALGLFGVLDNGERWLAIGTPAMFVGVALLSPKLVPPLAALVGRPLTRLRGVPARLAHQNSVRNPGRTAATAASLMVGLALVTFVAILAAGIKASIDDAIDESIIADLYVANEDGFSDIPLSTATSIAGVEGVEAASATRFANYAEAAEPSEDGSLTLVDPRTAADVLELDWDGDGSQELLSSMAPTEAVVDKSFADDAGIEVGDNFRVLSASGKEIDYTVTGTFEDKTDFIGDYAASDENAAAYGEGANASSVLVKFDESADPDQVRDGVEAAAEEFPTVQVQNQQELKDSLGEELNTLLGGVYGLLLLAIIVSLFGIVNTLALSIHERTRELGLLRAVGTSRRQVRRIVRYEAVITALIGAVLGAALGIIFALLVSQTLSEEGFELSIPFGTLVLLLVLSAVAGVLAAIGPARRASRLDVLEALSYE
jgi:putative ABC transport system permease protein